MDGRARAAARGHRGRVLKPWGLRSLSNRPISTGWDRLRTAQDEVAEARGALTAVPAHSPGLAHVDCRGRGPRP